MPPQWAVGRPKPYLGQTPSAPFPTIGPKSKWAYPGLPEPTEKGGGSGSHREGGGGRRRGSRPPGDQVRRGEDGGNDGVFRDRQPERHPHLRGGARFLRRPGIRLPLACHSSLFQPFFHFFFLRNFWETWLSVARMAEGGRGAPAPVHTPCRPGHCPRRRLEHERYVRENRSWISILFKRSRFCISRPRSGPLLLRPSFP